MKNPGPIYVSYYTIKPEGKACFSRNEIFKPDGVRRRGFSAQEQYAQGSTRLASLQESFPTQLSS